MDSSGVPIQFDPVAPAEVSKSRDVAPGRKRDDQTENKEATAASAALTVSFAEILQSKRQDLKAGTEEQGKNMPAAKGKKLGHKTGEEWASLVKGRAISAEKRILSPETGSQEQLMKKVAEAPAELTAKTLPEIKLAKENKESLQIAELPVKGKLSAVEEGQLKEMIQKNGALPGRKDSTIQMKGVVNGEPLNRPEGIGAARSMTAHEGEVLKNLSGDDEAQTPQKIKTGKVSKSKAATSHRAVTEGEGKATPSASSADGIRQEFENLLEDAQNKEISAGLSKKQASPKDPGVENRDAFMVRGDMTAPVLDKSAGGASPVRPQALVSQVVNGAIETLRDGTGRAVLNLQPPRLGTLDLDVAVKDNRVTMILLADNQEVKQMLQSGMDDLRNALQEKGFQIDRLEVLVQNRPDESGSNFWQQAGFAQGDSQGKGRQKSEPETPAPVRDNPMRTARTGENGISIFA